MNTISKKGISIVIVALFLVSISAGVIPVHAKPATHHVHEGQLIQPVIDGANAGDKIVVHKGTYSDEQLIIDKALTLKGKGAMLEYNDPPAIPHPQFPSLYFAIAVVADDVRISGFEISVTNEEYLSAVDSSLCSGAVIDNNVIEAPQWGVSGYGETNVQVANNEITATTPVWYTNAQNIAVINNVIYAQPRNTEQPLIGIYLPTGGYPLSDAQVKNNLIYSDGTGIEIGTHLSGSEEGSALNVEVKNNEIHSVSEGIYIDNGLDAEVKNNVIYESNIGIEANSASRTTIKNNVVFAQFIGVSIKGESTECQVKNNEINSENTGISVTGSNMAIKNNDVYAEAGIVIGTSSYETNNIKVKGNVIHDSNVGIVPVYVSNAEIKNNVISLKVGSWFGIGLSGSNNVIKSNVVTGDFEHAINLRFWEAWGIETNNNLITKNVIIGGNQPGDIGIDLGEGTIANIISKNDISEVDFPIVDNGDNIIIP